MKKGIFYFRYDYGHLVGNLSKREIPMLALMLCNSIRHVLDNEAVQLLRLSYPEGDFDIRRNKIGSYDWKCAFSMK